MRSSRVSEVKVGLLVVAALTVLAVGITLIGKENNLFRRKNLYAIRFDTVAGLNAGNPVQLNGVAVGTVKDVILPQDPGESEIQVWIRIDRRYAERVRADSQARIKTLGLLGDKYVEITSGSPQNSIIPDGGLIPTAPATSVDELLASGEDVMDNVTAITFSLRNILERTERGEGMLGELTTASESGQRVVDSLVNTLSSVRELTDSMSSGEGPLPRLIHDRELGQRLAASVDRLDGILSQMETGDGLLPSLLNDPGGGARFQETLDRLNATLANLELLSQDFNEGNGLLPKLIQDEAYSAEVSESLRELLSRLNRLTGKMAEGDGTVSRLLNDPQIYQALNDILIGIDESWMLRWLIRNRQKAGIEERYTTETRGSKAQEKTGGGEPPPR